MPSVRRVNCCRGPCRNCAAWRPTIRCGPCRPSRVATGDDFQAEFSVRGSAYRHVGLVLDGVATPAALPFGSRHAGHGIDRHDQYRRRLACGPADRPACAASRRLAGRDLDFDLREGSRDRLAIRGAVSGTNASTVIEGPLTRGRRGSWLLSVRKSYVDWLVRKIDSSSIAPSASSTPRPSWSST